MDKSVNYESNFFAKNRNQKQAFPFSYAEAVFLRNQFKTKLA